MDLEKNYPTPRTSRTGRTAIWAPDKLALGHHRALVLTPGDPRAGGGGAPHFLRLYVYLQHVRISFNQSIHTFLLHSEWL